MNRFLIWIVILCIGTIAILSWQLDKESKERQRLKRNHSVLLRDSIDRYRAKNNLMVASIEQLELTVSELKQSRTELMREIKNMRIKPKRVISVSETATRTEVAIKSPIRDTIYIDSGKVRKVKQFNWSDHWTQVNGVIANDSVAINYKSVDTLVQVLHIERRKFLFIQWGVKAIRQSVMLKNPNAQIVSTEYIKIR